MKRIVLFVVGVLLALFVACGYARASDVYDDYTVAIDTSPSTSTCDGTDGCLTINARSFIVQNTGSETIYMRFDSNGVIPTTGRAGIAAGSAPISIDVTDRHMTIEKVYFKTTSSTSTALVRVLR